MELAEFLMAGKVLEVVPLWSQAKFSHPGTPGPSCFLRKQQQIGCRKLRRSFPEGREGKSPPMRAQEPQGTRASGGHSVRRSCPGPAAHGYFPSSAQGSGAEGSDRARSLLRSNLGLPGTFSFGKEEFLLRLQGASLFGRLQS